VVLSRDGRTLVLGVLAAAMDEHQARWTGLLWRLLRHGEAAVCARSIAALGGRLQRQ
jgi:hypothetical protein